MTISVKTIIAGVAGLLAGATIILGIRFFSYSPAQVHYHANFAVYINGHSESFNKPMDYLDGSCTMSNQMTPEFRAHLVKGSAGVVHVQAAAVTWGQFFENLGWHMGDDFIQSANGTLYTNTDQAKLHIILNDQDYTSLGGLSNAVIQDKDRLLLSYGNETVSTTAQQFSTVPRTAAQYDGMKNTAGCGHTTSITTKDRLNHLF